LEEYGFPSTHTANAVVWARALFDLLSHSSAFSSSVAAFLAISYIVLIGVSRLYLGVHSLADLFGGLQIGFMAVFFCDYVLGPFFLACASNPNASVDISVILTSITVDSSCIFALSMCLFVLFFYPDRRDNWTTYKDTLSIIGMTAGAVAVAGVRLSGLHSTSPAVPFGGSFLGGGDSSRWGFAVGLGSCLLLLLLVQESTGKLVRVLEANFGFKSGVFKLARYLAVGVCLTWSSSRGVCHLTAAGVSCTAANRPLFS
jgi:hypothetical protein